MVPTDFATFFAVMAGVGATLFGLIFLAVSMKPESTLAGNAPVMRQVQVASSYTALLNPLVISLIALVPHNHIGLVTLIMSSIGLTNTLIMSLSLVRGPYSRTEGLRRGVFSLGSFLLFGFEFLYAIRLSLSPTDLSSLDNLTTLLVIIYLYGIARAWDLIGVRQFHLQEVLFPLTQKKHKNSPSDPDPSEGVTDPPKDRD
jgi:hypothetical protein